MKYLNDIGYKDCVGKVYKSKSSGDFKILKYNDKKNVEIQFLTTGYETTVHLGNIRNGSVKDRYLPSVCGVGVLGTKYPSRVNGRKTKEYVLLYGPISGKRWEAGLLSFQYSDRIIGGYNEESHSDGKTTT